MVMQLIGAIAAAALCKLILNELGQTPEPRQPIGQPLLGGKTVLGALSELVGTFVLVWAIMGVAVNERATRDWAGFVIGATLGFAVMATRPARAGGSLNPARALGPAIVAGHFDRGFGNFLLVYVVGSAIGGLVAAVGYKLLVLDPQTPSRASARSTSSRRGRHTLGDASHGSPSRAT